MPANKRYPRIERDERINVQEDENSHLWAVSYSDFLMALLSFFILFFSMEPEATEKPFLKMISQITATTEIGTGLKIENNNSRLPAGVVESLKKLDVKLSKEKDSFVIDFPNDFFSSGEHRINVARENIIVRFLDLVKPYDDQIDLYFEGHTDDTPLQKHKNNIVVDNFVLSSLRASSALQIARRAGFSEKHMYIQAASSNLRNSRSLSIRIEPRKETL